MAGTETRYSPHAKAEDAIEIQFPVAATFGWDGFWRSAYQKADLLIQRQANELLARGNITMAEFKDLVETQRNGLVLQMREPLSPFGKFYSESLKPAADLPTAESLLARKGSIEAVLVSVGKSRAVTNRIAFIGRSAGTAGVVLQIVCIAVVVEQAPPNQRTRVATEEVAGAALGVGVGSAGAWSGAVAGAAWAGTWASPTLVIPVVGEITEGAAIVIGGIAGGLFFCWATHDAVKTTAHAATDAIWRLLPIEWK